MQKLSQKHICHHYAGFEERVRKILSFYKDADLVIEGHFHQGKQIDKYLSLPSLACQNQVASYEKGKIAFEFCYNGTKLPK